METQEEKVARVVKERVELAPYNPEWPELFERERRFLLSLLPPGLVRRVEHFGSTAVPGLAAKPVVDLLVEVASLAETRTAIAPALEALGYDYFWRPSWGDSTPPFYAWFIKRGPAGERLCHIHMVEKDFEHWDRLFFRDYLRARPDLARDYGELKQRLSREHPGDRVAYTQGKTEFILRVTHEAKKWAESGGKQT